MDMKSFNVTSFPIKYLILLCVCTLLNAEPVMSTTVRQRLEAQIFSNYSRQATSLKARGGGTEVDD